jgi:MatE
LCCLTAIREKGDDDDSSDREEEAVSGDDLYKRMAAADKNADNDETVQSTCTSGASVKAGQFPAARNATPSSADASSSSSEATPDLHTLDNPPAPITDNKNDEASLVPSYRKLLVFCSTTVLIWLSEPLLSLVDTTVVGWTQQNAVLQLASLGPATTLIDSLFYLTYFLSIATTNRIAAELAASDYRQLQRTTSHVLTVSLGLGVLCTAVCLLGAQPLLTRMAGASASAELLHFATRYTWIRGSVAVVSVTGITMQSFCLATLDTATPAKAMAAASIVNIIGDLALKGFGVQGAAAATAAASLLSSSILFRAVRKKLACWRRQEELAAGEQVNGIVRADALNTKRENMPIPIFSIPDRNSALQLITLAGP